MCGNYYHLRMRTCTCVRVYVYEYDKGNRNGWIVVEDCWFVVANRVVGLFVVVIGFADSKKKWWLLQVRFVGFAGANRVKSGF